MPLEDLPDGFTVPTRGEVRDRFQKDYLLRQPGAPTGEGSQAFIDGSVIADALMPLYANAVSIARGANLADMTRAQLQAECVAIGIPIEMPESAGSGFVIITASAGGVYIDTGKEIKDEARNLRFHCATAGTYYNGKPVPIIGTDKGPTTNIPAGTKMKWSNPPAGLGSIATVQEDANGDGFTGGRGAETDDGIVQRIETARADPPAGGNVAHIRKYVKEAGASLGIAIEEVFVYPAITGSGHYAYIFTLRPGTPGSSRCPDAVQIAAVRAFVQGALPEDDGIFAAEVIEEEVTAKLGVRWAKTAPGWVDAQPWPTFTDAFEVSAVTGPLAFDVESGLGASYVQAPQVGQTFAFYDRSNARFARKRVLTVVDNTGGNFSLTIDDTNDSSDVNYTPDVGDEFCPYSTSLDLLIAPLLSAVDKLGPGEQEEDFFDEGSRQRRTPENPIEWASELRHNTLDDVDDLAQIHDLTWLAPTIPYVPAVGVPGVSSNLIAVTVLLAYPI